jgi:hypothetical protein
MSSCEQEYTPQEVALTLDYSFIESGSMTKTIGEEVYDNFYEEYIKNKILTPTTYSLTFTNVETGAVANMNGFWKNKDAIRLTEGEYEVVGTSVPTHNKLKGEPSDTTYLTFSEKITITKDLSSLVLQAQYDSYLLMFDVENIQEIYYEHYYDSSYANSCVEHNLYKSQSLFTMFVKDLKYGDDKRAHRIYLIRKDGQKITITLDKFPFEKGKYYYFNDMTNSFDIPKMESGN